MKTSLPTLLILSFLLFSSCNDEDFIDINDIVNDGLVPVEEFNLEGTWLLTSFVLASPIDLDNNGVAEEDTLQELSCPSNDRLIFNMGGDGFNSSSDFIDATFNVVNGETSFSSTCTTESQTQPFTWVENGSQVTITIPEISAVRTFTITAEGTLLGVVMDQLIIIPEDPANDQIRLNATFEYTRQ